MGSGLRFPPATALHSLDHYKHSQANASAAVAKKREEERKVLVGKKSVSRGREVAAE